MSTRHLAIALLAALALAWTGAAPAGPDQGRGTSDRPAPDGGGDLAAPNFLSLDVAAVAAGDVLHDSRKNADVRGPVCPALPGGLDHAAAGIALRNGGYGTISLQGVSPAAVLVDAWLYVGLIFDAAAVPGVVPVSFEGRRVPAALFGVATEPCWNGAGVYAAYRANVAAIIPRAINGDYLVECVPSNLNHRGDPWGGFSSNAFPMAEGASLVVIVSDPAVPGGSVVYIHEGPFFFSTAAIAIAHPLVPAAPGPNVKHTRIGADGQVGFSVFPGGPAITGESTFLNAFQIKGPGSPINTDSDWNGYDGEPLNQLWDTHTTAGSGWINAGDGAYTITYSPFIAGGPSDCINPTVHVLTSF